MGRLRSLINGVGWLSFSIFFNLLNTIIFSTLFPKYLSRISTSAGAFSRGYSIINTLTTLLSAFILPLLGSLTDQLNVTRSSLYLASFLGWLFSMLIVIIIAPMNRVLNIGWLPMVVGQLLFITAMFFLRVAVMNNNALLSCFELKSRSMLSIVGNCLGFTVNLVGLGFIRLWPPAWTRSIFEWIPPAEEVSVEGWWILIFSSLAGVCGLLVLLSPSGSNSKPVPEKRLSNDLEGGFDDTDTAVTNYAPHENSYGSTDVQPPYSGNQSPVSDLSGQFHNDGSLSLREAVGYEEYDDDFLPTLASPKNTSQKKKRPSCCISPQQLGKAFYSSVLRLADTVMKWRSNPDYFQSWLFLFTYVFVAAPGVVFTVIMPFMFLAVFPEIEEDVNGIVDLNLYYKVFMVVGVFFALFFEKIMNCIFRANKYLDMVILLVHTVVFQVLLLVVYLLVVFKFSYPYILWTSMLVGFVYSWNTSVTRGFMSKLIPVEKKGEFMGLYSSFTYIGITFLSAIDGILKELGSPSYILLLLLVLWAIPGYLFLGFLFITLKRRDRVFRTPSTIDLSHDDDNESI